MMSLFDGLSSAAHAKDNIRTTPILIDRHVGNLSVVEGNQNVGKDLIPGDLRLTEVSFTPPSRRTYLSVLAGLR